MREIARGEKIEIKKWDEIKERSRKKRWWEYEWGKGGEIERKYRNEEKKRKETNEKKETKREKRKIWNKSDRNERNNERKKQTVKAL